MEKSKIDKVIDAFRAAMYHEFSVSEEGMVAILLGDLADFLVPPMLLVILLVTTPL